MYPTGYPSYPNCFDMLTTHGVIADDLVGYVTGEPSPYLQNYVAQRGGMPSLPGQVLPDPLPDAPRMAPLPRGDVYVKPDLTYPEKKDKYASLKKFAAAVLLIGLGTLGVVKGAKFLKGLKKTPAAPAPSSGNKKWYQKFGDWISAPFKTKPGQKPWYQKTWETVSKPFKTKPGQQPWYKQFWSWLTSPFAKKPKP